QGGVRVQVTVGGPDGAGLRAVAVYSARENTAGEVGADTWTRHATGTLTASTVDASAFDTTVWPPAGAEPVALDTTSFYADLASHGYAYGPAFQGLRAVWRRDEEIFAEVALPDEQRDEAARFGLHPALLDAALHTGAFAQPDGSSNVLPFAWNGLALHAAGAAALRVRIAPRGTDVLSLVAVDENGGPVLTVDSVTFRPVDVEQLDAAATADDDRDALFGVEWIELSSPAGTTAVSAPAWTRITGAAEVTALKDDVPEAAVLELESSGDGEEEALARTAAALETVQAWLADDAFESARLVVLTRGAVPAGGDGAVTDAAGAAVWGLVRAAQAENPGRIVL
ncbi:polyketide synthase dehydratase domain-containing protein, partial [Streptomyces sp. NPDC055107]